MLLERILRFEFLPADVTTLFFALFVFHNKVSFEIDLLREQLFANGARKRRVFVRLFRLVYLIRLSVSQFIIIVVHIIIVDIRYILIKGVITRFSNPFILTYLFRL